MTESRPPDHARHPRSDATPRPAGPVEQLRRTPREEEFLARLRQLGVSAGRGSQLLAEWSIVARARGLDPADRGYWDAAADWLLLRIDA